MMTVWHGHTEVPNRSLGWGLPTLEGSLPFLFIAGRDQHIPCLLVSQCNKMPKGRGSLPPQHGLELLTVYAWEQGGCDCQFSMAEGFRTVLELVRQYRQLCVYWTVNYDNENETVRDFLKLQLQKPRSRPPSMPGFPAPGSLPPSPPPKGMEQRQESLLSRAELLSNSGAQY